MTTNVFRSLNADTDTNVQTTHKCTHTDRDTPQRGPGIALLHLINSFN